jgi:hypothetical protein
MHYRSPRAGLILLAATCLAVLGGCKPKGPPTGTVTGQVTYNSQPVTAGMVVFENPTQAWIGGSELDGQGRYRIADLRAGDYIVSIQPPAAQGPNENTSSVEEIKANRSRTKKPDPANIPRPVRSSHTSPLKASVVEGNQVHSFELSKTAGL